MTFDAFKNSVLSGKMPAGISDALKALWQEAAGDWDSAHETVQPYTSGDCAWVHAYLHRKEGDIGNARYWYSCAQKPSQKIPLNDEWENISKALLGN